MKKWLLVTLLLTIVFTTSACNQPIKEKEPVNIHILLPKPNSNAPGMFALDELYKKSIVTFHQLNPLITVTIDYITESVDFKSDSLDIIPFDSMSVEEADKQGILLDLLPLQRSSGAKEIDINKRILDTAMVDGKLLILPYSANPLVVLYNKDFFDKVHIPYPQGNWTWEQFRDISKKLKPAPGTAIPYLPMILEMLMASTGKSILSPNADTSVGYLDSPQAISSIQWLNHYYKDDELKTTPMSFMDAGIKFNNFQTGMALGTIESYTFYKKNLGEKISVAPLPHFEDGTRANPISFSGFGISKNSKHPEQAWAYIQYLTLTNHENAAQFSNYNLTTSKAMSEAVHQNTDPIKSKFADEMNYAVKSSGFKSPLMYNEDLNTLFQELLKTDDNNIPAKLHDLALKVDQEIKRLKNAEAKQTESASP